LLPLPPLLLLAVLHPPVAGVDGLVVDCCPAGEGGVLRAPGGEAGVCIGGVEAGGGALAGGGVVVEGVGEDGGSVFAFGPDISMVSSSKRTT
jgi:hypothetical protein